MTTSVYFNGIKDLILKNLSATENEVSIAVAWFTNEEIFAKIISLLEDEKKVNLIILDDFVNNGPYGLDFQNFIDMGGKFYYGKPENPIHHKFCIVDKKVVLTGSYNWTYYAEYKNYENIVQLTNPEIIDQYIHEYNSLIESLIIKTQAIKYLEYDPLKIDYFRSNEYLSQDLIYRGINLNRLEFIETARKINPTNPIFLNENTKIFNQQIKQPAPLATNPFIQNIPTQGNATPKPISQLITNTKSLGISARINNVDDKFFVLIKKGTMLPAKESSKFFTTVANQTSMTINTHKGEDEQASNNPLLGKILISDLPPLPIGEASVTVTFSLNEKGELKVIVLSDKTGNSFEAYYYAATN